MRFYFYYCVAGPQMNIIHILLYQKSLNFDDSSKK